MKEVQEDSPTSFFLKNLLKGLAWFAVIITAYILVQGELKVYEPQINKVGDNLPLLVSIFTVSEVVFGILPPEIFMLIWRTKGILSDYILNLTILTFISFGAGIVGYFIGYYFSKAAIFKGVYDK